MRFCYYYKKWYLCRRSVVFYAFSGLNNSININYDTRCPDTQWSKFQGLGLEPKIFALIAQTLTSSRGRFSYSPYMWENKIDSINWKLLGFPRSTYNFVENSTLAFIWEDGLDGLKDGQLEAENPYFGFDILWVYLTCVGIVYNDWWAWNWMTKNKVRLTFHLPQMVFPCTARVVRKDSREQVKWIEKL